MISHNDDLLDILDKVGLILIGDNYRNTIIPASKKNYRDTLEYAKEKGYYIYYGELADGQIKLPYFLDINSIPKESKQKTPEVIIEEEPKKDPVKQTEFNDAWAESLICTTCGKQCTSKSGYTLHIKKCGNKEA